MKIRIQSAVETIKIEHIPDLEAIEKEDEVYILTKNKIYHIGKWDKETLTFLWGLEYGCQLKDEQVFKMLHKGQEEIRNLQNQFNIHFMEAIRRYFQS